jgi:ribosomal protein S12 methylthiotransferase
MDNNGQRPLRVGMISLGCAKNLVDAEIMLGSLLKGGVEVTNDAAQADVVIVNTCSFIDAAQEESVDTILESHAVREAGNRGQGLVVAGCLPQRFRDELPRLLPEVDAFMGIDQVAQVTDIVQQALSHRRQRLAQAHSRFRVRGSGFKVLNRITALDQGCESTLSSENAPHPPREHPLPLGGAEGRGEGAGRSGIVGGEQAVHGDSSDRAESGLRDAEHSGRTRPVAGRNSPSAIRDQPSALVAIHPRPTFIPDFATPRFRLTPPHYAYLKVAEGCNHPCSFCIIPRLRGTHRSRPLADVVAEARQLLAGGVKELNLISQDTTYYGLDLRPDRHGSIAAPEKFSAAARALPANTPNLCTLLRELNTLPGTFWIRLLYTHPAHWTDELIQTIAECSKVARYVDMPLQHIHPNMLERMRRETSQQYIIDLIRRIRAGLPGIALRTTLIVGFPGETEACFQTLLGFIRETKFERLGVFSYSQEQGTVAARMENQVPARIKQRRRDLAMAAQREVGRGINAAFVGRVLNVLIEKEAGARDLKGVQVGSWEHGLTRGADRPAGQRRARCCVARSEADAPEVDGRVYVRGRFSVGEFARVRIIGHTDYDFIAEPA